MVTQMKHSYKKLTSTPRSHYERRGERTTERIASAVAKKSWKWTIINLAWTVGPVTYVALQVGHFIGYGASAPSAIFYYFAGYTLVAGTLAVIGSILHDALYKPRIEKQQQRFLEVTDNTFSAILAARNMLLGKLDPEERKIMSAYYILQNVGMSPAAIEAAVYDITASDPLTTAARKANSFAELGMQSCVDDIFPSIETKLAEIKTTLHHNASQAYDLLEQRLKGHIPSIKIGIERSDAFIERVLAASEHNDDDYMSLNDVMEVLTLAYELIHGRYIALLDVRVKGDSSFEQAQEMLDEARHRYRLTLRKRNSHIRQLADTLYNECNIDIVIDATDATSRLVLAIERGISQLKTKDKERYRTNYENILKTHEKFKQAYTKLINTESDYTDKWKIHGKKLSLAMQEDDLKEAGFYIEERSVALTDKQKISLINIMYESMTKLPEEMTESELKYIAITIADALDDMIDMSQPEELLAIESSNATHLGFITKDLPPKDKANRTTMAIEAMHENRRKASHRLARNLIMFYRLPLTNSVMQLFKEKFGADIEYLQELNRDNTQHNSEPSKALPSAPMKLKSWNAICSAP